MSAKIKRAGAKTAKALAVVFFLFLVVFNVQIATSNEQSSDVNMLGLSLSVFTPSAYATQVGCNFLGCNCGPVEEVKPSPEECYLVRECNCWDDCGDVWWQTEFMGMC